MQTVMDAAYAWANKTFMSHTIAVAAKGLSMATFSIGVALGLLGLGATIAIRLYLRRKYGL